MRSTVTPVVDIRPLPVSVLRDTPELWKAHWEETASEKAFMPLDPDWPIYLRIEAAGAVLCLGVFDEDRLVGYSFGTVAIHPNSRNVLHYNNSEFYVMPSHRGVGKHLYHETREAARDRGARFIIWRTKPGSVFDRLLHSWAVLDEQENVFSEVI